MAQKDLFLNRNNCLTPTTVEDCEWLHKPARRYEFADGTVVTASVSDVDIENHPVFSHRGLHDLGTLTDVAIKMERDGETRFANLTYGDEAWLDSQYFRLNGTHDEWLQVIKEQMEQKASTDFTVDDMVYLHAVQKDLQCPILLGDDHCLYQKFGHDLRVSSCGGTHVVISDEAGDVVIGSRAAEYGDVHTLDMGMSVELVGAYAFAQNTHLAEVKPSLALEAIDPMAFAWCTSLKKFDLQDTECGYIDRGAFEYSGLSEITIPATMTYIGDDAFRYCRNLTTVVIEERGENNGLVVGHSAFANCPNLVSVRFENGEDVNLFRAYNDTFAGSGQARLEAHEYESLFAERVYIHYGHQNFDAAQFEPIQNRRYSNKPSGGLWASDIDARYGWLDWNLDPCGGGGYAKCDPDDAFCFRMSPFAMVYDVNSVAAINNLMMEFPAQEARTFEIGGCAKIDFEAAAQKYDAINVCLSDNYEVAQAFPGWDVDSLLVLRPQCIVPIDMTMEIRDKINAKIAENEQVWTLNDD